MNINRKVSQVQITVSEHLMLNVPAYKELFYCYEVGEQGNEHTHVGLLLSEQMSLKNIIKFVAEYNNLAEHQVDVKAHKNWGTVWGYHYGFGGKVPCDPAPIWITKTEGEVKDMVSCRLMHRKLNTNIEVFNQTKLLLENSPIECLKRGYIHLKGYRGFKGDHLAAMNDLDMEDALEIPLAPKKRHHWYWGPSNTGKSTAAKELAQNSNYFIVPRNNDWQFYKGQKVIIIEEYKGKFWTVDTLQELCDCDNYQVNTKGGSKCLPRDSIIAITSRVAPEILFADQDAEDVQGIFNRFFVHHMTIIYNSTI